ncbi:MAG: hypothetical protein A2015_03185 [Spirochaetes bacterium GWF1_31_7]|nr:MAG: hypothetical protein A2Y30_16645 [Spirochaetes bacterium GWE1_32_154]OHD47539.1 MAG: hypothetical protein A2Y29_09155 [Spirochaetes bacterium GWE2_31_10]OHD50971.1 MAG: hypothetical protein A2015_03185 [Spirochaetes bacterium GWF1_31_7]OHD83349.1 MAG: hypothetical protein A2355_09895 [Spirochaetes bacterium RIFOXYB1_FULL_32_8]HBD94149.1 hypothetical protein [Spirochaetia bacterium]
MLIVRFSGGLGNQIFQYMFYRYIQQLFPRVKVKADISNYEEDNIHNGFEISNIFRINKLTTANNFDILKVKAYIPYNYKYIGKKFVNRIIAIINKRLKRKPHQFITKLTINEWEKSFKQNEKNDYYFDGCYWQYPRFFETFYEIVLKELKFKQPLDITNSKIADEISNCNSVSIHIRKGDYIGNSYDILTEKYYLNAIEILKSKTKCDKFYIFSDDSEFSNHFFKDLPDKIIICHNKNKDSYKDMQLMSLCKNNIIANSSFSTCAALLNANKEKIVIYPDKLSTETALGSMPIFSDKRWIQITAH